MSSAPQAAADDYNPTTFPSQHELYDEPETYDSFVVRAQRNVYSAKIDARNALGPDIRISRYTDADDSAVRARRGAGREHRGARQLAPRASIGRCRS